MEQTMNYQTTYELLELIKPYVDHARISISTDNFTDDQYKSDLVTIDEKNEFAFEVFDDEVSVYYFTAFKMFFDHPSDQVDGQSDYIKKSKDFLIEIFENKIRHTEVFKGKEHVCDMYFIVYPDNTERCINAVNIKGFLKRHNPFLKEREVTHIWEFDKRWGCFLER